MPLISVKYKPSEIPGDVLNRLLEALPQITADALTVPIYEDGKLTKDDIEIEVSEHGPLDVNTVALQIIIKANYFTAREANLKERTQKIVDGIIALKIPKKKNQAFVWVTLVPAAFVMF